MLFRSGCYGPVCHLLSPTRTVRPHAVWTVRGGTDEAFDRYIVVSFIDVTLVLSIGDTVEEVRAGAPASMANNEEVHPALKTDHG